MLCTILEALAEHLVRVLGTSPAPCTARELQAAVKRDRRAYTLQAIYKELRKLRDAGVVVKHGQTYAMRIPWALDLAALADAFLATRAAAPTIRMLLGDSRSHRWRFQRLARLNEFWSQALLAMVEASPKTSPVLGYNPHPWFYLLQPEQERQYTRALARAGSRLYLIIGGRTPLDRASEAFFGEDVTASFAPSPFSAERRRYLNCVGEYVLTVTLDAATATRIDMLYTSTGAHATDAPRILNTLQIPIHAALRLEHAPRKAQALRRKFARFFGERL